MLTKLNFTGNWFIDAGILGFVNLMEEVYGWDLEKILEQKISKEKFFFSYFIYYIKKTSIDWINRQNLIKETKNEIKEKFNEKKRELIKSIKNLEFPSDKNDYNEIKNELINFNNKIKKLIIEKFKDYLPYLKKSLSNNKRTIVEKIEEIGIIFNEPFFQSLNFVNPTKNKKGKEENVVKSFKEMIFNFKIKDELTKDALDKTISKFLFSEKKFPNIIYCRISTIKELNEIIKNEAIIFLLSFPIAFSKIFDRYVFFYTNNLELCYSINKKIKIFLERFTEKNVNIFKMTWNFIIDTLVEYKASFTLENMYLIEYKQIQQQELKNVEYIGIPKLQAQVLLDDQIRNALNVYLQVKGKNFKGPKNVWLLEEFIKGKPLYKAALNHIKIRLSKDIFTLNYAIFYALLLNAAILEFKEKQNKSLFSDDFLSKNYKEIVQQVKQEFPSAYYYATQVIPKHIKELKERERIAYLLLDALYGNNKARFLNILLKKLNNGKNIEEPLLNWIFNKIVNNEISWKDYALLLTGGMVYKNG